MNLYLLTQTERDGYDTYDSCVVAADSWQDAVLIDPRGQVYGAARDNPRASGWAKGAYESYGSWCSSPAAVKAEFIGTAAEGVRGVVCASFNAG